MSKSTQMSGIVKTFLLDTTAAIALLENDQAIAQFLNQAETFVPSITLGELYSGAEKSGKKEANLKRVDTFAKRRKVLACDAQTARLYGQIDQQLRKKGRPIPVNDKWIAAVALQYGLTVLTRDAHFSQVDGLTIETW